MNIRRLTIMLQIHEIEKQHLIPRTSTRNKKMFQLKRIPLYPLIQSHKKRSAQSFIAVRNKIYK